MEGNPVAVVQFQDPAGHVVQEVPVMGHGDDRALVLLEVLLKPLDRFGVQMVRRLIQQEDIGFLDQQPAERDPALFPTGENLDLCFWRLTPKRIHGEFELVLEFPAIGSLDLLLDLALLLKQLLHLVR